MLGEQGKNLGGQNSKKKKNWAKHQKVFNFCHFFAEIIKLGLILTHLTLFGGVKKIVLGFKLHQTLKSIKYITAKNQHGHAYGGRRLEGLKGLRIAPLYKKKYKQSTGFCFCLLFLFFSFKTKTGKQPNSDMTILTTINQSINQSINQLIKFVKP